MQQLVYRSRAIPDLGSDEVFRIIETSARNNPARDVTGFLVFASDRFVQLVEGPAECLDDLLADLAVDRRHRDLQVLERREVTERSFPSWRMERLAISSGNPDGLIRNLALAGVSPAVTQDILAEFGLARAA